MAEWIKKDQLGIQTNFLKPVLEGLKEVLKNEKEQMEKKVRNLKRLGLVAMDENVNLEELNKKLKEIDS